MKTNPAIIGVLSKRNPFQYVGRYLHDSDGVVDHSIDESERLGWGAEELARFWCDLHWVKLTGKRFDSNPVDAKDAADDTDAPIRIGEELDGPTGTIELYSAETPVFLVKTIILISLGDSVITTYHQSGHEWVAASSASMITSEDSDSFDE